MKRRDLERELRRIAKERSLTLTLVEGGNHAKATIGSWSEPLPRHNEVSEMLARTIIKRARKALEED